MGGGQERWIFFWKNKTNSVNVLKIKSHVGDTKGAKQAKVELCDTQAQFLRPTINNQIYYTIILYTVAC